MLSKSVRKRAILCAAAVAGAVLIAVACDMSLTEVRYELKTGKLTSPVRIVFISDLHNSLYGKNQSELIEAVDRQKPDIVVLGGDIADKTYADVPENAYILASRLGRKYPCYYSMGNHEYQRGDSAKIKQRLSEYGVRVLEGNGEVLDIRGNKIEICGIYDADTYNEIDGELVNQLEAVTASADSERYRVLIAHFPQQIEQYAKGGFDLVLSGHAHGGQWRIPGLIEGVYAPGQGLFPKYTGGVYEYGDTSLVVSRGLWKPLTIVFVPRIFNRPELVTVDIVPE